MDDDPVPCNGSMLPYSGPFCFICADATSVPNSLLLFKYEVWLYVLRKFIVFSTHLGYEFDTIAMFFAGVFSRPPFQISSI